MMNEQKEPHVFRLLSGEALDIHHSPTCTVGRVFREEGLEAVWVAKQQEVIDTAWFSQSTTDLLIVLQGQLRVEFEQAHRKPLVLESGEMLVLPPRTLCRAYRWPRDRQEATIFLAIYSVKNDRETTISSGEGESFQIRMHEGSES